MGEERDEGHIIRVPEETFERMLEDDAPDAPNLRAMVEQAQGKRGADYLERLRASTTNRVLSAAIDDVENEAVYTARRAVADFTAGSLSGGLSSGCPEGPHRGPQGPNEDVAMCPSCWSPTFAMRPEGETFGEHLPDCSLPLRHEGYCKPGGNGHPPSQKVRGC